MNIKYDFLGLIGLLMLLSMGCNQPVNKTAVIVSDFDLGKNILLVSHIEEGILDTLGGEKEIKSLSYTVEQPLILTLTIGRSNNYAYLSAGDTVMLERNGEGGQVTIVSKAESAENAYLTEFSGIQNSLEKDFGLMKIAAFKVDSFKLSLGQKYEQLDALMAKVQGDGKVNENFKKALDIRLKAMKGNDYMGYKSFHTYLTKEEPELPADYFSFLEDKFYDDPSLLLFAESRDFGTQVNGRDIDFTKYESVSAFFDATFEETKKTFSSPLLQNYYQFSVLDNQINFGSGLDGAMDMIEDYKSRVSNKYMRESLASIIEPWLPIRKGMAAPDFAGMTRDGKKVNLSDLKGKSVYVDVWATWCGPCIKEIPSLKKLEKDLHDTNVEFVSISIDPAKDKQKWLDFIKKESLGGTQLMAEGDWKSDVTQGYNIQGIPRFLLIDAEGKIVSANAPRPSSAETKALIESNS